MTGPSLILSLLKRVLQLYSPGSGHGPGGTRGQPGSPFPTRTLSSHVWLRPAQVVGIPRPRGGWWRDGGSTDLKLPRTEWQGSKPSPPALQTVMVQGCSRPGQLKTEHGGLGPGLLGPTPCVLSQLSPGPVRPYRARKSRGCGQHIRVCRHPPRILVLAGSGPS